MQLIIPGLTVNKIKCNKNRLKAAYEVADEKDAKLKVTTSQEL